jgi:hypothetical protein
VPDDDDDDSDDSEGIAVGRLSKHTKINVQCSRIVKRYNLQAGSKTLCVLSIANIYISHGFMGIC